MNLSVITVNLNNATGLRQTMASVLYQSFDDFEYIIIDGASKDASVEIFQQVNQSTNRKIQWISEPDSGPYEAMNKGIRLASGEYLLFLNSGDFLVNDKVLADVFNVSHTADFLLGRCHVSVNGKIIHTTNPPQKVTFGTIYIQGIAHQATFIRRDLFLKYGFYREDFRYNADIEFWYRTIIMHYCSTESLTTLITNYNKQGMSFSDRHTDQYQREMEEIHTHPLLQLFIPDYDDFLKERLGMEPFAWARSKPALNGMVTGLYGLARRLVKHRN